MSESDGAWGELVSFDTELGDVWDGFTALPEPGENAPLDALVARKHLTIGALVRIGARLVDHTTLAFAGPGYIKFRDLVTDRRWTYSGSDLSQIKVVRAGPEPSATVIVAEGETDGARLTSAYDCDVAIMPGGAGHFPPGYTERLAPYELVLVGLDNDGAGERGAAKVIEALPNAHRWPPPAGDWCEAADLPPLPTPEDFEPPVEAQTLVSAGALLELEPPHIVSWFEHALLPVAGQLILHGWAKSYKSFIELDLAAALAQGQDWCCFEPTEEPCRVAVMQYEIPWAYYQQRVRALREHAREPRLFDENFLSWTPLRRPAFIAGNVAQEDFILKTLTEASVDVFMLDPVRRATGVADLNSEKEVRPLLAFFQRLQDNGITVVALHHDNKTAARSGGGDPLGMTGVGAFAGDADTIVSVAVPKGATIEDPVRNLHFTLRNAPAISARGMEMTAGGHIVYSSGPLGAPDDSASGPAI